MNPKQARLDRYTALVAGRPEERPGVRTIVTHDRAAIREWAAAHAAEPATGEATASGPAVKQVTDEGPGIRFNFPGFAPFRRIDWEEWFEHFDRHELAFVYEEEDRAEVADRAQALWHARGRPEGDPQRDWYDAEHQLQRSSGVPLNSRYAIVKASSVTTRTPPADGS